MSRKGINYYAIVDNTRLNYLYIKNWSKDIYIIIEEGLTKCNINIILIKIGYSIEIIEFDNNEVINLHLYQYLIGKLIYFAYSTRLDIAFAIKHLNK